MDQKNKAPIGDGSNDESSGEKIAARVHYRPQLGPQTTLHQTEADIAIYGGAAGAGKTYALLAEPLKGIDVAGFTAVMLRRTLQQVRKPGGPWDDARRLYANSGAKMIQADLKLRFDNGSSLTFGHIEHEKDLTAWDGSQIALLLFDQLESFEERMFFYMLSRNRTTCGLKPKVRASCNPDARSWLAEFIKWWIDRDTGFPIEERSGQLRWMSRIGNGIHWHDSQDEGIQFCRDQEIDEETARIIPKSVTFIPGRLDDNQKLTSVDPGYKANLLALSNYDRNRLLQGNWKQRPDGGEFLREWFIDKWFEKWPLESALIIKTMALDPSKGAKDRSSDYQALIKLAIDRHQTLYVQAIMMRLPIKQMIADSVEHYRTFAPDAFCVEANNFQDLLKDDIQDEFIRNGLLEDIVYSIRNSINKVVRIRTLERFLANDRVRFMANCPGTQLLIDQLADFPEGTHEDGPDAFEMAIRLAKQHLSEGTFDDA